MTVPNSQFSNFQKGAFFAVCSAMASGMMLPLGKGSVVTDGIIPFLFYVTLAAALMGVPLLFRKGGVSGVLRSRKVLHGFVGHSFLATVALWLLWQGTSHVPAAIAGFLSNTHVVFSVILSLLFLGERIGRRTIAGGFLILGGLVIMRGNDLDGFDWQGLFDPNWWIIIASAATFAGADMFIKLTATEVDMLSYLGMRNIVIAVAFAVISVASDQVIHWDRMTEVSILGTALIGIIGSRLFFNLALQRISLSRASLVFQIQPLFVALFSFLLFGELPQSHEWLGGFVMISGVTLVLTK